MLDTLYGGLKFKTKIDLVMAPIKIIYMIYTIPFLLFAIALLIKGLGAFRNPLKEKIGTSKKIFLHISAIFWSWVFWRLIFGALLPNAFNIHINIPIFTF